MSRLLPGPFRLKAGLQRIVVHPANKAKLVVFRSANESKYGVRSANKANSSRCSLREQSEGCASLRGANPVWEKRGHLGGETGPGREARSAGSGLPSSLPLCWRSPLSAVEWPQFRGPRGDGHSAAQNLPTTWGGFLEPPVWQTSLAGTGWSSPIVWGDRIWVTAAEQTALTADALAEKQAPLPNGDQEFQAHAAVSLLAIELDAATGKLLRRLELATIDNPAPIHPTNSYASPTPVTDGERLFCHFGSLGTFGVALETGQVIWKQCFAVEDITGPGSSPILCDEHLVLTCDGADEQFLVALDKRTGEVAWRTPRPKIEAADSKMRRAFSTPLVIEHEGRRQLIAPGAQWIVAYDPANGGELWRVNHGSGYAVVPRPVFRQGLVYICTGYMKPELWAVRVDGSGDVTNTHVAWKFDRQAPEISSPVVVGEEIYFVSSRGIATCLDAQTGKLIWQHRLEGSYAASLLAADDKLYITSREGTTTVLRPGREYQELARNQLFGQTMASLAVAGDALLIRTAEQLVCVRKLQSATGGQNRSQSSAWADACRSLGLSPDRAEERGR